MSAFSLELNYSEEPWLRKAGSKNATKEKIGSVSEQISFIEKSLHTTIFNSNQSIVGCQ